MVPLQRSCAVEGGVGDVGDVHLVGDGGMERGDAQIIPPPGVGKVPGEGEKGVVCRCPCSKILQAQHDAVGGVWTRLVVGYTWTWVSAHGIEELVNAGRERG